MDCYHPGGYHPSSCRYWSIEAWLGLPKPLSSLRSNTDSVGCASCCWCASRSVVGVELPCATLRLGGFPGFDGPSSRGQLGDHRGSKQPTVIASSPREAAQTGVAVDAPGAGANSVVAARTAAGSILDTLKVIRVTGVWLSKVSRHSRHSEACYAQLLNRCRYHLVDLR